ncbi:MAG: hypothetical protein MJ119_07975 [Lachnospiraceae bacterium]|nr:hypothetical protein [Lachnospiraceae bacterium]
MAKVGESFQRSSTLKKTAIRLTEKFANVNSNYSVVGMPKLVGAYANYFEVVYGDDGFKYIRVKNGFEGRLKKGFTYKLKVKYTLKMASSYSNDDLAKNEGETVDIYSSVIKIKRELHR